MGKYGEVAVNAARLLDADSKKSPLDAWNAAAKAKFRGEIEAEKKSCPRGAFLGLCEEGLVRGVVPGEYTGSDKNKSYALEAVRHLLHDPGLGSLKPGQLWKLLMNGADKRHNSQMDVVLALWNN